jgi:hypothetical protein
MNLLGVVISWFGDVFGWLLLLVLSDEAGSLPLLLAFHPGSWVAIEYKSPASIYRAFGLPLSSAQFPNPYV